MQAITTPVERTLTQIDYVRLTRLLTQQGGQAATRETMQEMLESSDLVPSPEVPPTVVTMYTQVLLEDLEGGEPYKLTLCYPADAEPANGFISVLSPVGSALLGLRVGQTARWAMPGGAAGAARIQSVLFQPEASGDYQT